jgi:CubicO group peptidase (beta-lactamase class C family)
MRLRSHLWFQRSLRGLFLTTLLLCNARPSVFAAESSLASDLDSVRTQYHLPALAGAIFTTEGVIDMAAVGVRKAGTPIPVTQNDLWHLGSDTKAMTATLAGTFVAEKCLSWNDKVASFFPEIANRIPASMKTITLRQVMAHEAGLVENLDWTALSKQGSFPEQRRAAARLALTSPAYAPGTFHYANTDYVVVGAVLEKLGGKPWEDLIRERIFQPLGMTTAGFGGTATPGKLDQPWPHLDSGVPDPSNGAIMYTREILGPAGTVHCSMADWARFLSDQLRGGAGMKALLPNRIYEAIQTPYPGSIYGLGWGVVSDQAWTPGKVLTHDGSNGVNYCTCWLSLSKKFGVLVCSNQGGDQMQKACDAAASLMVLRYLHTANP